MWNILLDVALCVLAVMTSHATHSKRVLIIPMPFTSHTKYQTNVAVHLNRFGHQIWVCMPPFVREKVIFKQDREEFKVLEYRSSSVNVEEFSVAGMRDKYWRNEPEDSTIMFRLMMDHVDSMMKDETFLDTVRSIGPDLILIDNIPPLLMMAVLPYKLNIPFAFLGTWYLPIYQRIPFMPHLTPPLISAVNPMDLSFYQRLSLLRFHATALFYEMCAYDHQVVARYAPERPYVTFKQLVSSAEIFLIEIDHIMDAPQPALPNVKLIGGTCISEASPLTGELKTFVENSKKDILVVAFGSYISHFPKNVLDKLFRTLEKVEYNVVWRVNMTSPMPEKYWMSDWIPQNDLLGHPKVKVFISHCGKNSQYEALYHAVPFLCFPIFADQPYNAQRTRLKGYSLTGDLLTITVDDFVKMIEDIGPNSTYKANIERGSQLFKINQGLPVERAAFWLDHVMTFGGEYMRTAGQGRMATYEYYGLDIIFVLFLSSVALGVGFCFTVYLCVRRIICRKNKEKGGAEKEKEH